MAVRSFAPGLRTSGLAPAFPCALPQHQVHCQIETQPTIMCLQARLGADSLGVRMGVGWAEGRENVRSRRLWNAGVRARRTGNWPFSFIDRRYHCD
eukprot:bmy_10456T0